MKTRQWKQWLSHGTHCWADRCAVPLTTSMQVLQEKCRRHLVRPDIKLGSKNLQVSSSHPKSWRLTKAHIGRSSSSGTDSAHFSEGTPEPTVLKRRKARVGHESFGNTKYQLGEKSCWAKEAGLGRIVTTSEKERSQQEKRDPEL